MKRIDDNDFIKVKMGDFRNMQKVMREYQRVMNRNIKLEGMFQKMRELVVSCEVPSKAEGENVTNEPSECKLL